MDPDREHAWEDDTNPEIVDLTPQEAPGIAGALVDLSARVLSRIHSLKGAFKVSLSAPEEEEDGDSECEFDLRYLDLAAVTRVEEQETATYIVQDSDTIMEASSPLRKWRHLHHLRIFSPLTLLLLFILAFTESSASYQQVITVARPTFSTGDVTIGAANGMGASSLVTAGQKLANRWHGRLNGWHGRTSDNATIVIPGVAVGHNMTPTGPVNWYAAPMPPNCSVSKDTDAIYSSGQVSLWLVGSSYPYSVVHLHQMSSSDLNSWHGWELLVGVLMKRGFTGPITLTLSNQFNGPSPSFHGILEAPPTTSLTIDLSKMPAYVVQSALRGHIHWNIPVYLPGAGCYTLNAQWPGGTHLIAIRAGQ